MSLSPGSSIGPYQIVGSLGAGGMGEVYRARDTRLNRDVAIKTLPASVATDRERAERFDREAKLLAALNHPHIGGIHGIEHSGGVMCLVLELVEGQSLAARISGTPLPVEEALRLARQIADALIAAHDRGIIHRDLKPANVMVTADGQVKVLDFGLGKIVEPDSSKDVSNSPTMSLGGTQVGMLLGTAAYMSPEQAKGLPADKRSDVWAFGCVLFEMLTGARAFHGDDVSETLASVLKSDPGWGVLPADVPPAVRALLEACLEKSRRTRLGDLSAAAFVIDRHQKLSGSTAADADRSSAPSRARWRRLLPLAATALAVAAVVSAVWWSWRPELVPPLPTRFVVPLTEAQALTSSARRVVAVSPDGSQVVFGVAGQLYIRRLGDWNAVAIPGTEGTPAGPVFSPDGQQIAFWHPGDRTLKRIAVGGGATALIHPMQTPPVGMRWTDAGLVAALPTGVIRISDRGEVTELMKVEAAEAATDPQVLPDGRHLLVTVGAELSSLPDNWDKARVMVYDLDTGTKTLVRGGATAARYLPSGHLVYAVGGTLFAAPFDLRTLRESGPSVAVVEGVRRGVTGVVHYDVSPTGVLAYVPGPAGTAVMAGGLGFTDRTGAVEQLKLQPGAYSLPRASPDGKSIAFELAQAGGEISVWVYALAGGTSMRRLTLSGRNRHPVWSHDSQRIAFQSDREGDLGIFMQRADGTGGVTRLTKAEAGTSHMPESFSPDGAHLLYSLVKGPETTLWVLSVKDGRTERFGNATGTRPMTADFHPSGKWVAYASDAGRQEGFVFVQPFPATGEVHQISKDGENGHHPKWTPDGKELLYVPQVGRFVGVSVSMMPTLTFTDPKSVPRRFAVSSPLSARPWDIAKDGRVLSLLDSIQSSVPEIRVILNWFEELRARAPVR